MWNNNTYLCGGLGSIRNYWWRPIRNETSYLSLSSLTNSYGITCKLLHNNIVVSWSQDWWKRLRKKKFNLTKDSNLKGKPIAFKIWFTTFLPDFNTMYYQYIDDIILILITYLISRNSCPKEVRSCIMQLKGMLTFMMWISFCLQLGVSQRMPLFHQNTFMKMAT